MTKINDDIIKIADQAFLKILADDKVLVIKHKIRLSDKSTLGMLFFLLGGIFLIVVPYSKTSTEVSKYIGLILGLFLLVLSILTLIRQANDGIKIRDGIISFRHNLKLKTIHLNGSIKVKMKIEVMKIRRRETKGSDFIIVTHFLQAQNKETPILKFQMDNANAENAKKLGNELTRIINAKFR
ncbi:hypothetical protein [Flavobacterium soli]|uniref:hypothetical protein n=1 Tax=Flavobacterium soli TaxID=344881 RepID=UPI0004123EE6|nr:hypothetical protein [Flavobacterium soli]